MERHELKEVLNEIFEERTRIDSETHAKQHEWVAMRIVADRERIEFYKTVRSSIVQWSVLGILGALATRIWSGHWPTIG